MEQALVHRILGTNIRLLLFKSVGVMAEKKVLHMNASKD
jgi:hypothetical protein